MYDFQGKPATVNLRSFFEWGKLYRTNILEEYPEATDDIQLTSYGIETYLLKGSE
jgi:hypothetical protein